MPVRKKKSTRNKKNVPRFDWKAELQRVCGVDLTSIDGIDVMTAQTVVAELGTDFSRWKDEAHLTSWLGLVPCRDISGGKVSQAGNTQGEEPRSYRTPGSRQYSTAQRQLSRSPFPFPANPARSTQSDQSHGSLSGLHHLPNVHARAGICRSRRTGI